MAMVMQKDRVTTRKRETFLNVAMLDKLHPMSSDSAKIILKENAFEKPTQNMFNHISHYLLTIIDSQASASLPWPLYDTTAEKKYRKELSNIISRYNSEGLVAPVMSSYFVNPGCFKVVNLMYQLSQLAVQRSVLSSIKTGSQKKLYDSMTEKYEARNMDGFTELFEEKRVSMKSKCSNFLYKRKTMEKILDSIQKLILRIEEKILSIKAQGYIDNVVVKYLKQTKVNEKLKAELMQIKDIDKNSVIFESWLVHLDTQIDEMEAEWDTRMSPLLKLSEKAQKDTETLVLRETGVIDKSSFVIEYNPKTDYICTEELQKIVNSEQKYVLKNIINNDRLNFPNLIRGFLISICHIMKNVEIIEDIYEFNVHLDAGRTSYKEFIMTMKNLLERVRQADSKLKKTPSIMMSTESMTDYEFPPLLDLSDLKMNKEFHPQIMIDRFTPNLKSHKFNLRRNAPSSFIRPLPKIILDTPYRRGLDDNFIKSVSSCRMISRERPDDSKNIHNLSVIPLAMNRGNETIAERSSGFTRDQINRLLSTKKICSSKKLQHKNKRSEFKKGLLFNESNLSYESFALTRSHSSPNLCENRERRFGVLRSRKLSYVKEVIPSLLEVSGIALMDRDSNHSTPDGVVNLVSTRKNVDASSLPSLSVTPEMSNKNLMLNVEVDLNQEMENDSFNSPMDMSHRLSAETLTVEQTKLETPKTNTNRVTTTNSLEKIINRFKKVGAVRSCASAKVDKEGDEIKTIVVENQNVNVDMTTMNRILLPDLLSPSCNLMTPRSIQQNLQLFYDNDDDLPMNKRMSLGGALGVDNKFLDQFDLVD